ncbi:MAG: S8 family serine peptidase [Akkermansiaceae bacterium]|nr:S8 family serine peptidase [Armatimonadota bacterium]
MRSGVGTDPLQAYLRGMRDAIDAVLRFQGGSPETQMPLPLPDSGGMMGIQQDNSHSWCLSLIGIPPGYKRATGKNVKVAVLDTGVDLLHPDFAGRFTEDVNARSFVEGESVQDGNGHGTHCAGVVGGPARSSSGRRYGVAPDTDLMVGKVLSNAGSGFDDQIIDGIDWAADQGAEIISMSLGSLRSVGVAHSTAYERIAAVLLQSEPSVLIIAAAGNESARPFSLAAVGNPAACPSIMAVAAVDQLRRVARFSCAELDTIGPLDVSGPGVAVFSAYKDGGFTSISGTSMATPHVAGVAALYRELDPSLTAARLRQQIMTRLTPLGIRRDFGQGLVQAP